MVGYPYDPWYGADPWADWGWTPWYAEPIDYGYAPYAPYRYASPYWVDDAWQPVGYEQPILAAYSPEPVVTTGGLVMAPCSGSRWAWDPDLGGYVEQPVWDCWVA